MAADLSKQIKLWFLCGLAPQDKPIVFERILFRATRGNVFLMQEKIEQLVTDPASGEKSKEQNLENMCEAFGATCYTFNESIGKQTQMIVEVSLRLNELKTTIDVGLHHHRNLSQHIGDQFERWGHLVRKEKAVYHTLNMLSLDVTKKCLVTEGWCPVFAAKQIQDAFQRATYDSNAQVEAILQALHTKELPPTYFRTNRVTSAFQEIVDAYRDATTVGLIKVGYKFYPFSFALAGDEDE